jgi:translation initiation factor IF-2
VVAGEAGGITQRIGAYQVEKDGKRITFLDTPGHEAFTAMRARGASVTDIAVLVVAVDDGVMPQTIEAIDHVRAAGVPMIVALNKIDIEGTNVDGVKQHLADLDLVPEDWGGDVICVPVSAREKIGLDTLLEMILLVAEMQDLRANPKRTAAATVIEGQLDRAKGPLATLLVEDGTLTAGDCIVIGETYGRIRAMFDYRGRRIESAGPATPVVVLGLHEVPRAGDRVEVVQDEKSARSTASERLAEMREADLRPSTGLTLEEIFVRLEGAQTRELNLILKVDAQGSISPVVSSLEGLGDEELRVNFIRRATGQITESDVMLARASQAVIIGFGVGIDPAAQRMAETEGVDIRLYHIIYRLIEDIDKALKGLLEPVYEDVTMGKARVLAVFRVPQRGSVAGVQVTEGKIQRSALARLRRGGKVIYDGRVASLRRFTEDVSEVETGFECGVGLEGFQRFEEGDIIEFYGKERVS